MKFNFFYGENLLKWLAYITFHQITFIHSFIYIPQQFISYVGFMYFDATFHMTPKRIEYFSHLYGKTSLFFQTIHSFVTAVYPGCTIYETAPKISIYVVLSIEWSAHWTNFYTNKPSIPDPITNSI